jgi:hypothetical protein
MGFKPRPPAAGPDSRLAHPVSAALAHAVGQLWRDDEPIREPRVPNIPLLSSLQSEDLVEWRKPAEVYARGGDLVEGLREGRLSAVWYALRVVPRRDPEAAVDPALTVLEMTPGTKLRQACQIALRPSMSKRAFDVLLASDTYGGSAWPHGCAAARERLSANPATNFEPHPAPASNAFEDWTDDVKRAWTERRATAGKRFRRADCYAAVAALEYLGRYDWAGTRATIESYRDHPADDVRLNLGHAISRIGTSAALELLLERAHSADRRDRFFAVKAAFRLDAFDAYNRLGGASLVDGPAAIVAEAFDVLSKDHKNLRFDRFPAYGWLQVDDRWHDLAVVWARKSGEARDTAKWILADLSPEQHKAARKRTKRPPRPKPDETLVPDAAMLERWWSAGTFWRDAQAIGETIRRPAVYDAAYPIVLHAMRDVRAELERIVGVLARLGYRFVTDDPLPPPADNARAQLTRLESLGGPLPLSVRAAYEVIGPVHLAGWHPRWPVPAHVNAGADASTTFWPTDAFSLVPLELLIEHAEDNAAPDTTYRLAISPDDYGKAGFSGGHYSFEMPCPRADTRLDGAHGSPMFIAYVAESLRWGGFPGFARVERRPADFLRALAR